MGPGWGGTFGERLGHAQRRTGHASTTFPLLRPFRAVPWRTVAALARPVTPEVAGSSPVAPVFEPPPCRHSLDERSGTYEERDGSNPSTSRAFSIAATTLFASEPESAAPASPWTTSVEQTTAREARRSDPVELGLLGDGDGREARDRRGTPGVTASPRDARGVARRGGAGPSPPPRCARPLSRRAAGRDRPASRPASSAVGGCPARLESRSAARTKHLRLLRERDVRSRTETRT